MSKQQTQLNSIAYTVILLTVVTAFIHLYLSFQFPEGPDPAFLLNGIGYLLLVTAIYAPLPVLARYRSWLCWILIAYTALTITLWIFFGATTPIAYIDKAVEIGLIPLAWLEARRFAENE